MSSATQCCSKCSVHKSPTEFGKDAERKDGRPTECNACTEASRNMTTGTEEPSVKTSNEEQDAQTSYEDAEQMNAMTKPEEQDVGIKTSCCSKCRVHKPRTEFGKDGRRNDGIRFECNACMEEKKATTRAEAQEAKTKCCSKCQVHKCRTEFCKDTTKKDGIRSKCKDCTNKQDSKKSIKKARKKAREEATGEMKITTSAEDMKATTPFAGSKCCTSCNGHKLPSDFHKQAAQKDGLRPYCKACVKERSKEYGNRPEVKARNVEKYAQDYRERVEERESRRASSCAECGTTENREFFQCAHFRREDKRRTTTGKALGSSTMRKKGLDHLLTVSRWLCPKCHLEETLRETQDLKSQTEAAKKRREELAPRYQWLNNLKLALGACCDCGDKVTKKLCSYFHFSPVPGSEKIARISSMISNSRYTLNEVEAELAKCQMRCTICSQKIQKARRLAKKLEAAAAKAEVAAAPTPEPSQPKEVDDDGGGKAAPLNKKRRVSLMGALGQKHRRIDDDERKRGLQGASVAIPHPADEA